MKTSITILFLILMSLMNLQGQSIIDANVLRFQNPMPANTSIDLHINSGEHDLQAFEIWSMEGYQINSQQNQNTYCDDEVITINGLLPGMYIIRFLIGGRWISKRFIVK